MAKSRKRHTDEQINEYYEEMLRLLGLGVGWRKTMEKIGVSWALIRRRLDDQQKSMIRHASALNRRKGTHILGPGEDAFLDQTDI